MCVGLPGQIVEVFPDRPLLARVSVQGAVRVINLGLLDDLPAKPGEWVLILLGLALERMTEAEAAESLKVLEALGSDTGEDLFSDLDAMIDAARAGPAA
ncbi:MAG: HypC/HybG/HupF family hydrogenase formation chaperone [Chloroflexi bacterium]|nr:HypC/HybG/HupF family hydrogenase formation chaperone [Chloroflexota bacterium]